MEGLETKKWVRSITSLIRALSFHNRAVQRTVPAFRSGIEVDVESKTNAPLKNRMSEANGILSWIEAFWRFSFRNSLDGAEVVRSRNPSGIGNGHGCWGLDSDIGSCWWLDSDIGSWYQSTGHTKWNRDLRAGILGLLLLTGINVVVIYAVI